MAYPRQRSPASLVVTKNLLELDSLDDVDDGGEDGSEVKPEVMSSGLAVVVRTSADDDENTKLQRTTPISIQLRQPKMQAIPKRFPSESSS